MRLSISHRRAADERSDDIYQILGEARSRGATDVHLVTGSPIIARLDGDLTPLEPQVRDAAEIYRLIVALLSDDEVRELETRRSVDVLRVNPAGERYRVNVAYTRDHAGAVIRILPTGPLPLESLRMPAIVEELATRDKGLILVTGSTSMGKTTTMASIVDRINRRERRHIITIEDPVEYVHENINSLVRQREVGRDVLTFADGLRSALRQDPDVILIGEIRDYETIEIALSAAESGVLVISTLHIMSVERIVDRLMSLCPPGRETLIRTMLGETLVGVIHQELLPSVDGGKRVACEVLVATRAVRYLLRSGSELQIRNALQTGSAFGMLEMSASLHALLEEGAISEETALRVLRNYQIIS